MKTGFSLCSFSLQGKPCNENRFLPVKKNYTGKTLFSLQGRFAVRFGNPQYILIHINNLKLRCVEKRCFWGQTVFFT